MLWFLAFAAYVAVGFVWREMIVDDWWPHTTDQVIAAAGFCILWPIAATLLGALIAIEWAFD